MTEVQFKAVLCLASDVNNGLSVKNDGDDCRSCNKDLGGMGGNVSPKVSHWLCGE